MISILHQVSKYADGLGYFLKHCNMKLVESDAVGALRSFMGILLLMWRTYILSLDIFVDKSNSVTMTRMRK